LFRACNHGDRFRYWPSPREVCGAQNATGAVLIIHCQFHGTNALYSIQPEYRIFLLLSELQTQARSLGYGGRTRQKITQFRPKAFLKNLAFHVFLCAEIQKIL
jgi:hypothetical protein